MQIDPGASTFLLSAATRYRDDCGWIVHPLHGPNEGTEKERGKKPKLRGWKKLELFDCDDAFLQKHFVGHAPANVGVVIQPPHVVIDLDSKKDDGQSVLEWLASKPALAGWPRERTAGGVHLHLRCEDVPAEAVEAAGRNQKLTATLGEGLTAELFLGGNVVVAPSVHKTGHRYTWEVTGEIPLVSWADLEALFFDQSPVKQAQPRGRPKKEKPFWAHYRGDLRTLDVTGLAKHLGIYGQPLGGEDGKHTVRCPWRDQHSDAHTPWSPGDSSTVVWQPKPGSFPNFFCAHISHGEKTLADFLAWAESRERGVVDKFCKEQRIFEPDDLSKDPPAENKSKRRPRIILPGAGRLESEFAHDVGLVMGRRKAWFLKSGLIVEIKRQRERVKVKVRDTRGENDTPEAQTPAPAKFVEFTGFALLRANRAITSLEAYVEPGILVKAEGPEGNELEFVSKSMNNKQAAILIESDPLITQLPEVERILDVPQPVIDPSTGNLTFPHPGHDPRFNTYLVENAPALEEMPLDEAKGVISEILQDFCFKSERDVVHAIAAIITPFCRGLFDRWTSRTPVFFYRANRPRAGKDYLAGCVGLIYEGRTNEDAPLTSDTDETRKKITSALISGRRRIHFSNCAGFLRNDVFEQIVTNERWSDRTLGSNQEVTIPNEIEFSLSGNTGVSYTPDFGARTRIIALHFEEEHENLRVFSKTDLHGWIVDNRSRVLSAIWALVRHWDASGRPAGPSPFTSFPSWAEVVGGIMHACGLGDPCLPDDDQINLGGDSETRDMKGLYALAYEKHPETWLSKKEVREIVLGTDEGEDAEPLFAWLDLETKGGQTRFGHILEKYVGRIFGGVKMIRDVSSNRSQRHRLKFTADAPKGADRSAVRTVFSILRANRPEEGGQSDQLDAQTHLEPSEDRGHLGHLGHLANPRWGIGKKSEQSLGSTENKEGVQKTHDVFSTKFKMGVEKVAKVTKVATPPEWELVTDAADFDDIAEEIAMGDHAVALDIETHGRDALNPRRSDIRLLCLSLPWRKPWLIDLQATGYDLGDLGTILGNSELVIHNARFDLGFLAHHCGIRARSVFCTLTASRLLMAGTRQSNSLGEVLRRYGIADLPKDLGPSDWGGMIFDDQLAYAAADVTHLHALRERLATDLSEAELDTVWALETELIPVVVGMEQAGFAMDREKLEAIREEYREKARHLADHVREALGATINPTSPDQLRKALQAAGVKVKSTAESVLANVKHPAAALVLEMRGAEKVAQQAQSLIDAIEADGRIHGQFDPTGTEAGRFAARSPNLQNIGRGTLRDCFVAPEGSVLVCADYSQIELRVAAAIANETRMIEAYRSGADLHRRTAALVLGKTEEDVTKDDRQLAKAVNFGLLYGQSAPGLVRYAKTSYGVEMTEGEAERIREKFFRAYTGLAAWHRTTRREARDGLAETRTRIGRRRLMPQGEDNLWSRFSGGLNTPVQGGAADGLKRALVLLAERLPKEAAILSTVHDEVIVECPEALGEAVARTMEEAMTEAMAAIYPEVPVEVEAHIGRTWNEAK